MRKNDETITLVELQSILSKVMLAVLDEEQSEDERAANMATANSIYTGARNLIHNASTIMRAKEIVAEGRIKDTSTITKLVGR